MSILTLTKPHTCQSQCDGCHTMENCVPAQHRYGDLLLCNTCHRTAGAKYGPAPRTRYFED